MRVGVQSSGTSVQPVIVFDVNCYYAAALSPTGYMYRWLDYGLEGAFTIATSPEILAELQAKLECKLGYSAQQSVDFRLFIEAIARVVHPAVRLQVVRDPDDNKLLECAVQAEATAVLSFDKDLLDLKAYQGIKIIHPRMLQYWFPHP